MVRCEIRFDNNPYGIYYSGQQVTGKVEITLPKKKSVQAIILNISGRAKTKWSEKNTSSEQYDTYGGKEQYLDTHTFLIGSPAGETITLDPGIHTFNFACVLPLMLPSSFEGEHGYIRYLVKVILERPWKFNQTHVVGFTVLREVDLNYEEPQARLPFERLTSKILWSGFCNSKAVSVGIALPQMGFVPGQLIPITLNIKNESSTSIDNFQINFKQIVTFKSQNLKRSITKTNYFAKKNYGEVLGYKTKKINHLIRVPPVPPSSKNSCSIINIDYKIEAVMNFGWFHRKLKALCPVIIGTVPFSSAVRHQPLSEGCSSDIICKTTPISDPLRNASNANDSPELRPPSYEEAVQMKLATVSDEDEHPMERSQFLPRYPVYTFDDKNTVHELDKYV